MTTVRPGLLALVAFVAVACSRSAEPTRGGADDALRRDLEAAAAPAAPAARTQFVSPLELGRREPSVESSPEPAPTPRRRAPRPPVRAVAQRTAPAVAPASPATEPPAAEAPVAADEPIVAAPSPRSVPAPEPARRRGGWTMGDVIRNAPFPIKP